MEKQSESWKAELSVEEVEHLKEHKIECFEQAKYVFNQHAKRRINKPVIEPCWECRAISEKLNVPV